MHTLRFKFWTFNHFNSTCDQLSQSSCVIVIVDEHHQSVPLKQHLMHLYIRVSSLVGVLLESDAGLLYAFLNQDLSGHEFRLLQSQVHLPQVQSMTLNMVQINPQLFDPTVILLTSFVVSLKFDRSIVLGSINPSEAFLRQPFSIHAIKRRTIVGLRLLVTEQAYIGRIGAFPTE